MRDITVYDIAREANVSVSTVSRVLNGSAPVKESTRKLILEIIKRHRFYPNALARSLIKKETRTIGIILPNVTNPFFPEVFSGAENALREAGYTFFLCTTSGNSKWESEYLSVLRERQVDGILFMGGRINQNTCEPNLAQEIIEISKSIPMVLINGEIPNHTLYRVTTDEYLGTQLGVQHLIDLGHKDIGFVGGQFETSTTSDKVHALRATLEKHGLSLREEWVLFGDFTVTSGQDLMKKLLSMSWKPSAVFCVNDFTSIGAMKTAIKHGLRIPDDLAIMGFDGTILAESMIPGVTTVSQNSAELGKKAVEVLGRLINGQKVEHHTVIRPYLVRRESTMGNVMDFE